MQPSTARWKAKETTGTLQWDSKGDGGPKRRLYVSTTLQHGDLDTFPEVSLVSFPVQVNSYDNESVSLSFVKKYRNETWKKSNNKKQRSRND
jgi:hypothetical protein